MVKNLPPILLLFLFLNSCLSAAKTTQSMNQWIGEKKHTLLMNFGPPDKVSEDGNGGEILVYIKYYSAPFAANTITLTNSQQLKMYFINTDGIVYHFLVKYQDIAPTQVDLNVIRNP